MEKMIKMGKKKNKYKNNSWWNKEKEEEKTEPEMEFDLKVKVNKDVDDKINWLTANYADEISAFLTGELKDGVLTIDGMLFPHQDVSSVSVDVEPKNLIKLRKEYGDECLRIVGHWHSHNTMTAFWSGTDDTFINQYSKTKDLCVFFVSCTTSKHLVKLTMTKPFEMSIDKLPYEVIWDDNTLKEDLTKIIEEKVTKTPTVTTTYHYPNAITNTALDDEVIELRIKNSIVYDKKTDSFIVNDLSLLEAQHLKAETEKYKPSIWNLRETHEVRYKLEDKNQAITMLEDIKFYLKEVFEIEKEEVTSSGYPDYYGMDGGY